MKVACDPDVHLTYCTNIHPAESWPELRSNLERYVVAVKEKVSPRAPFGVGLRVSAKTATELCEPRAREELLSILERHQLYVFTINGFPFGDFHGTRVKEGVYRPDWIEPERSRYSNLLARLLSDLLPDGIDGSVSTVPVGHAPRFLEPGHASVAAEALIEHAASLARLKEETGKTIGLALEPEPECLLETVADTIGFFENHIYSKAAVRRYAERTGFTSTDAEASLRRHLGICLDTCHAAVEFEDPASAIDLLVGAGIRVLKIQLSAGLAVDTSAAGACEALQKFADDVYLHQVVERSRTGFRRFADLDQALAAGSSADSEWRVHFHVPLFRAELDTFRTTQPFVEAILERQRQSVLSTHLEVETYTWDVLPQRFRDADVTDAIAREIQWVSSRLAR